MVGSAIKTEDPESSSTYQQQYTGGLLSNGLRHGKGSLLYENRFFKYTGDWVNGQKDGQGVLQFGDGGYYEGDFVQGEIQGRGLRKYPDGASYSGEFVQGHKCGEGIQIDAAGTKYEGSFLSNRFHGSGELTFPNGDTFVGEFVHHKRKGQGVLQCVNGDLYDGEWDNNCQHGKGSAVWSNGDVYQGSWVEGKRHGRGRFVDGVSSVVYDGLWENDCPTKIPERLHLRLPDVEQADGAETEEEDGESEEGEEEINLEIAIGQNWADIFNIGILQGGSSRVTRKNISERLVECESGRILNLITEVKDAEVAEGEVRVLCQMQTVSGVAVFPEDGAAVPDTLQVGECLVCSVTDATPGMRAEERLVPAVVNIKILAEGSVPNNNTARKKPIKKKK